MTKYNLAKGMSTRQSTTKTRSHSSSHAVDGHISRGVCAQTSGTDVPWWQVELNAVYVIEEVEITGGCACK